MQADERALIAQRLGQIAGEAGVDLSRERLDRLVALLETALDGARAAAALAPVEAVPAFVPDIDTQADRC